MSTKSKIALISMTIVLITAVVLGIKQKYFADHSSADSDVADTVLEEFNDKTLELMTRMDDAFEKQAQEEAQTAANANTNINSDVSDDENNEIVDKLKSEYYPEAELEKDLLYSEEKNISSVTLSTRDTANTVAAYYKEKMGEQVIEIESVEDEDSIETTLVLFSADQGEGELNVKILDNNERTYIKITISDSFVDPR